MTSPDPTPAAPTVAPGWYPDNQGGQRWWDGTKWTEHHAPAAPGYAAHQSAPLNGLAIGSLVTGILGFIGMGIPFFIGWFVGGPLDIAAVILGIVGISKARKMNNRGLALAIIGLSLGGVSLLSVFIGAGSIW